MNLYHFADVFWCLF